MAGGTWTSQNKVRPGVYIRFRTTAGLGLTVGERGTVAICEPMSWGPVARVQAVDAGANLEPFTGYDITNPKNRFLNEIFKGSNRTPAPARVLLYRPTASGSSEAAVTIGALTATALYPGVRGNDISVVVTALTDPADTFQVSTVVDGEIADQQTSKNVEDLEPNQWVTFSGSGALTADTGKPLIGGTDGAVQDAAYSTFLEAIEPYKFDILIYDSTATTIQEAMAAFVKRLGEESGQYTQLVAAGLTNPDSRYVINVASGVTLADGTVLTPAQTTWWVGGAQAGARYNQSLTYASYPGAVAVSPLLTNSGYVEALQQGQFVLFADDSVVKVEQDINSLVTYTPEIGEVFHKNRVMRLCSTIANDIYAQFSQNFIGVVNNNAVGRSQFKGAIVGYLLDIQANEGIQDFSPDDVQVLPGDHKDSILVSIALSVVDSTEKIYITLDIS